MALAGLMPVPEIQFRKYSEPATEQIHDCGTMRWRTTTALPRRWCFGFPAASSSAATPGTA
jgi:pyruvate/2-oxoglutarate/acetoin dehydrogenase E1 component